MPATAQQRQQGLPGQTINMGIRLRQIAAGSIDQHGVLGEIPVGIAGRGNIPGHPPLFTLVEGELDAGKIQQAGLAATLRTDHQIPRQLAAPALTAAPVETGAAQSAYRVAVAVMQFTLLFDDTAFAP